MTISVQRIVKRKAATDPHKNAAIEAHELRSENIAKINLSTVSRPDVGIYTRVGVKKQVLKSKFIIIGFDLRLLRNTKFVHMRIVKSIIFR